MQVVLYALAAVFIAAALAVVLSVVLLNLIARPIDALVQRGIRNTRCCVDRLLADVKGEPAHKPLPTRRDGIGAVLSTLAVAGVIVGLATSSTSKTSATTPASAVAAAITTETPSAAAPTSVSATTPAVPPPPTTVPVALPTATPTPTAPPTPPPTPAPTPPPTPQPTPKPTAPPPPPAPTAPPAQQLCGAPSNPWGYNFCSGKTIASPPANLCDYFSCIPTFWKQTNGYVAECNDGSFSHSGGRSGACSSHGGERRPLYGP
jgi:hypothetical protein